MIKHYQKNQGSVRLCKEDLCLEAKGKNAETIVAAASIALFLVGLGAFIRAVS